MMDGTYNEDALYEVFDVFSIFVLVHSWQNAQDFQNGNVNTSSLACISLTCKNAFDHLFPVLFRMRCIRNGIRYARLINALEKANHDPCVWRPGDHWTALIQPGDVVIERRGSYDLTETRKDWKIYFTRFYGYHMLPDVSQGIICGGNTSCPLCPLLPPRTDVLLPPQ